MLKQAREVTIRQRQQAANRLLASLKDLEGQGDRALASGAAFLADLIAARAEAQLGPVFGHEAVASLAAANAAFVAGMGHVVEVHRHLRAVPGKIGLEPVGFGEVEDCPPAIEAPQPALRAV